MNATPTENELDELNEVIVASVGWRVVETDIYDGISAEGATLELAICRFARKLFHPAAMRRKD